MRCVMRWMVCVSRWMVCVLTRVVGVRATWVEWLRMSFARGLNLGFRVSGSGFRVEGACGCACLLRVRKSCVLLPLKLGLTPESNPGVGTAVLGRHVLSSSPIAGSVCVGAETYLPSQLAKWVSETGWRPSLGAARHFPHRRGVSSLDCVWQPSGAVLLRSGLPSRLPPWARSSRCPGESRQAMSSCGFVAHSSAASVPAVPHTVQRQSPRISFTLGISQRAAGKHISDTQPP
jgi:hypothetical protein